MNAITDILIDKPCVYNLPFREYTHARGVSKSTLDLIHPPNGSPAMIEWSRNAPVDEEVKTAVDLGRAFHTLLLEPERFADEYVPDFKPSKFALVTVDDLKSYMDKQGIVYKAAANKASLTKTLLGADPGAPVADVMYAEWEKDINGRIVLSLAEHHKLILMRDSVMAHPIARKLLEAEGFTERSHFWVDEETGLLCKCRPDREVPKFGTVIDVKTTGEIGRFANSVVDYRYHVQDSHYRNGYAATQGEAPRAFLFLPVSTTRDRGRYPVDLKALTQPTLDAGRAELRADMALYAECKRTNVWPGISELSAPGWYLQRMGV